MKIDGKDLQVIKNLYWEQATAMRVDGEMSLFKKIKHGVRQGCVLSPDLFSLYSENIMLGGYPGMKVGGYNVKKLRYADDILLIAENNKKKNNLQRLLDIVEE